jgi:ornithine cyclodeaminase/alanine dehydrogenase-like protein (mu-crystallin family)
MKKAARQSPRRAKPGAKSSKAKSSKAKSSKAKSSKAKSSKAKSSKAKNSKAKSKAKPRSATKTKATIKAKPTIKARTKAALYLREDDVRQLVTVEDAIASLEDLFATWSDSSTINLPRQRARVGNGSFNLMGAAWGPRQLFGLKAYYGGGNGARFHVLLYSAIDGKLQAMIEADHLGQLRTGAASGLATKLLANPEARTLGVIGTGRQALTQVAAVCATRPIDDVRVFSPTAEHRQAFARRINHELGVPAEAVATAEAAVTDADVIITITKSAAPVLRANWLKSGVHLNVAGANAATRREVDAETVLRATVRATDQIAQARLEAGEYRDLAATGRLQWHDVVELGDLVTGKAIGRRGPADITLFKSLGIALEDIAFADLIYRRALKNGVGKPMP